MEILKQCDSLIGEILTPASTDEEQQLASMWSDVSSEFASQRKRISETLPNRLAEYNDLVQKAEQLASSGQYQEAIQLDNAGWRDRWTGTLGFDHGIR